MIGIDTIVDCAEWRVALPEVEALADRVFAASAGCEAALEGSVALLLADDDALRSLNRRFRSKDAPTNVLSFPSGGSAGEFMGDIALGYETCAAEAAAMGRPLAEHAAHLIAHGLLHLVGYDHESDEEALVMEAREAEILAVLGIADPYREI